MKYFKGSWIVFRQSFLSWRDDNAVLMSAALSYYALFSMAPILLIVIQILGMIVGEQTVKEEVLMYVRDMFGQESAKTVSGMIDRVYISGNNRFAAPLGVVILLYVSTNLFKNIKKILSLIWDAPPPEKGWLLKEIIDRLLSFSMLLVFGFLFLISLIVDTGLVGFGDALQHFLPGGIAVYFWEGMNLLFSISLMSVMFGSIFKFLSPVRVSWLDVLPGAVSSGFLITAGKILIGFYIGRSRITTIFGATSSLIVILIWIYYSAQLLFFGAEVTRNFAQEFGSLSQEEG